MKKYSTGESGFVSIFVTMMLIVIMSLLVMAFAQLSRREQRESLDNQLSSQAYYAAETGVNDAKSAIKLLSDSGQPLTSKPDCADTSDYQFTSSGQNVLSAADNVKYTCVIIDTAPAYLRASVGPDAKVLAVNTGGTVIDKLFFKWTGTSAGSPVSTANCSTVAQGLQTNGDYKCPFGGLRIDIVPATALNRAALNNGNMAVFAMPRSNANGGTVNYTAGAGSMVAANCLNSTVDGTCMLTISNLTLTSYYVRISSLYLPSDVTITTTGNRPFKDSQATIDATGKAQDVLRRILVSVPLVSDSGDLPSSALISGDSICKRFHVSPGAFSLDDGITGDGGNPLCNN